MRSIFGLLLAAVICSPAIAKEASPTAFFKSIAAQKLAGWNAAQWADTAAANKAAGRFCPTANFPVTFGHNEFVEITGSELAAYSSNVDTMLMSLHAAVAAAASDGNTQHLKAVLLEMAAKNTFTKMKPYRPKTWEGEAHAWLKTYPKFAETTYYQGVLLTAASQAFAVAKRDMSEDERALVAKWGRLVADSANTPTDPNFEGDDRRAMLTAAFLAWGAEAGDATVFKRGVKGYERLVKSIRKDGSQSFFIGDGHAAGVELVYQNMVYGSMTLAASVLEANGFPAFKYKAKGGSLNDGIQFHLEQTMFPEKRKRIQKQQTTTFVTNLKHPSNATLAWAEMARASPSLSNEARTLVDAVMKPGDYGYAGGHFGGLTSCLFRAN